MENEPRPEIARLFGVLVAGGIVLAGCSSSSTTGASDGGDPGDGGADAPSDAPATSSGSSGAHFW